MFFLYNLLLIFILPLFLCWFYFFSTRGNLRGSVVQRFGKIDFSSLKGKKPIIWFHAASVGEVRTIAELIHQTREKYGAQLGIALSVMTKTGYETAAKESLADQLFYLPVDLPWIVKKVLGELNPALLVVLETELWPNLFKYAHKQGCKVLIVNARISPASINKYKMFRYFMRRVMENVDHLCVQNEIYKQRFLSIGTPAERLTIVGDLKDEQAANLTTKFKAEAIRQLIHFNADPVFAAVSTHPGEEALICENFHHLKKKFPRLRLVIAPRHIHRANDVIKVLNNQKLKYLRRSENEKILNPDEAVILWDTFGELGCVYTFSTIVFVGGSLLPIGGHSLMEPAAFGVPVLWGPHAFNFPEAETRLLEAGGGIRVESVENLTTHCIALLESSEKQEQIGRAAQKLVMSSRGAVNRNLVWIDKLLAGR